MTEHPSRYGYAVGGRALRMCLLCGALVGDTDIHDKFHASIEELAVIVVTTSTNLIGTMGALQDAGIHIEEEDAVR